MKNPLRRKGLCSRILKFVVVLLLLLTLLLLMCGDHVGFSDLFQWLGSFFGTTQVSLHLWMKSLGLAGGLFLLMCVLALLLLWRTDLRSWRIDRMFAESPGRQLIFALAIFLFTLEAVAIFGFKGDLYKSFSDLISPISLRSEAYPSDVNYANSYDYGNDSVEWARGTVVVRNTEDVEYNRSAYLRFLIAYLLGLIVFSGLLIATVNRIMATRAEKYRKGSASYRFRNHYLIFGGNDMVQNIIKQIWQSAAKENPVVVVVTGKPIEEYRKYLYSELSKEQQNYTVILAGDMVAKELLSRLRIKKAREIFVIGDDTTLTDESHDAVNMQCTRNIVEFLPEMDTPIPCYVLFEYQSSFTAFQFSDYYNSVYGKINFLPYNFYENCVQKVFVRQNPYVASAPPSPYLPLERDCLTADSDDFVHLVIIGMTRMGFAMAVQAAQIAHYPNFVNNKQCRTRITLIDEEASKMMLPFKQRYQNLFAVSRWRFMNGAETPWQDPLNDASLKSPYYSTDHYLGEDFIDIEWEFIEGNVSSDYIQDYLVQATADSHARVTIAVCLPNPTQSAAAALYMSRAARDRAVQVLVYQRNGSALIDSISADNTSDPTYQNLHPFGTVADGFDYLFVKNNEKLVGTLMSQYDKMYDNTFRRIAEFNPSYGKRVDVIVRGKSKSARRWSNYYLANTTWGKLRSAQSSAGEISAEVLDCLAQTEHNRWVVEQLLLQFRPLTREEQDYVGTLHIDKAPYRALSAEEQQRSVEVNRRKEQLKGNQMAHLDICSFRRLMEIDNYVVEYDYGFVRIIPDIVREINQGSDASYRPHPFKASSERLRPEVRTHIEAMSRSVHEGWVEGRVGEGWRYGPERSYEQKRHPYIVDYNQLPESEKEYDRQMALQTLLLIEHLGYKIERKKTAKGRKSKSSADLTPLIERLAENVHEVWAQRRKEEGWRYGPQLDEARCQHPNMIPYAHLPQSERSFDRRTARRSLLFLQNAGFVILPRR